MDQVMILKIKNCSQLPFITKDMEDMEEMMEMKSDKDKEHHLKKVWSQYAACANVFLAPAYSDCMEQMDEILEDSIEDWRSAAGKGKIDQLQSCLILKQSNYWWKVLISVQLGRIC